MIVVCVYRMLGASASSAKSAKEGTAVVSARGVPTGAFAIHPLTGEQVPIWIGEYVLADYGTGAVMAVPAHDERDFKFAKAYGLPVVHVVEPKEAGELGSDACESAFTEMGVVVQSGEGLDGLTSAEAKGAVIRLLEDANRDEDGADAVPMDVAPHWTAECNPNRS